MGLVVDERFQGGAYTVLELTEGRSLRHLFFQRMVDDVFCFPQQAQMCIRDSSNLISNAIKYNRENGTVDVFLKSERQRLVLSVEDSGIGISKDCLLYTSLWKQ